MTPRLAVVPELDTELDRLYGLPVEEFTAARNALATRLRKAGQAEAAERVQTLRKPNVAVWTVNQLARRHAEELAALLDAGRRLREAQGEALRGEGSDSVREATAAERDALRRLTPLAERLLGDDSRAASPATLERIAKTLRAASVEPDAAVLLEAGRLPDEVESSGFAALASLAPPPGKSRRAKGKPPPALRSASTSNCYAACGNAPTSSSARRRMRTSAQSARTAPPSRRRSRRQASALSSRQRSASWRTPSPDRKPRA